MKKFKVNREWIVEGKSIIDAIKFTHSGNSKKIGVNNYRISIEEIKNG